MPRIVIEGTRPGMTTRVTLVDISTAVGFVMPVCSGDMLDECPDVGFEPGDTWSNGPAGAITAAEMHIAAHERRVCGECGAPQRWLGNGRDVDGELVGRFECTAGDHVEVIR